MRYVEEKNIIKKALLLVDKLAKFEKEGIEDNEEELEKIIKEAYRLKRHKYWKLN